MMVRQRSAKSVEPISPEPLGAFERQLIANSPAFQGGVFDMAAFMQAFAPPSSCYPGAKLPDKDDPAPNAERDWLIRVLGVLAQCYPHPVNMALDCLRISLIEVNRGLTPNLFRAHKPAKGGKSNAIAQEAMNLAVLAADFIHDEVGNDDAYRAELGNAATTGREIEAWRHRIDPRYRNQAIVAWSNLNGAKRVLKYSVADVKAAIARAPKSRKSAS
jgi:hypothetical protein